MKRENEDRRVAELEAECHALRAELATAKAVGRSDGWAQGYKDGHGVGPQRTLAVSGATPRYGPSHGQRHSASS